MLLFLNAYFFISRKLPWLLSLSKSHIPDSFFNSSHDISGWAWVLKGLWRWKKSGEMHTVIYNDKATRFLCFFSKVGEVWKRYGAIIHFSFGLGSLFKVNPLRASDIVDTSFFASSQIHTVSHIAIQTKRDGGGSNKQTRKRVRGREAWWQKIDIRFQVNFHRSF